MAKQSKITVKHYLEKKAKPRHYSEFNKIVETYPLYYRITYKRKTTNLKSFTGSYMAEKRLEEILENKSDYNFYLSNEKKFIELALEDIIHKNPDIEIFDDALIDNLKHYFLNLKDSLFYLGWLNYKYNIDNDTQNNSKLFEEKYSKFKNENEYYKNQFYGVFNKQNSLILNLFIVKKVTGYDLEPFIHTETLKFWYVINLILIVYSDWENSKFINLFVSYDLDKLVLTNQKQKYPVSNTEIDLITKILINNHLERFVNEKN